MGRNLVETVMGAVVLLIAGFFLIFAYNIQFDKITDNFLSM